jgi:hypothetical protein
MIAVAAGAIRSIARAFTAPDALDARFTDRQRRARAGLEADHIIPSLAELLSDASSRLPAWSITQTSEDELRSLLQDELNAADYLDSLRALGRLALDHDSITTSYTGAERAARVRGYAGISALLGLIYPAFWLITDQETTNWGVWTSSSFTVVSAVAMLGAWANETRLRIRLVRLCRTYERAA